MLESRGIIVAHKPFKTVRWLITKNKEKFKTEDRRNVIQNAKCEDSDKLIRRSNWKACYANARTQTCHKKT